MTPNFASALGMILIGLAFFIIPKIRLATGWAPLLLGALTWVVAVALKFAWALPVNTHVYLTLHGALGDVVGPYVFYAYVGLLTGVFECGTIYLAAHYLPIFRDYGAARSLAFGYGFGAVEALLLGLSVLVPLMIATFIPDALPEALRARTASFGWELAPVGAFERTFTVFVHAITTWLIFYAVVSGRIGAFWLAFFFKSGLDAFAVWAQLAYGLDSAAKIWTLEAVVALFGAVSIWGLFVLGRHWRQHVAA